MVLQGIVWTPSSGNWTVTLLFSFGEVSEMVDELPLTTPCHPVSVPEMDNAGILVNGPG